MPGTRFVLLSLTAILAVAPPVLAQAPGPTISDIVVEGTVTLPVIFALREGDAGTIRRVLAAPHPTPELLEAGIEAVLATDAVSRTEEWARGEIEAGVEGLGLLPERPEREFLEVVASEVVGRDA